MCVTNGLTRVGSGCIRGKELGGLRKKQIDNVPYKSVIDKLKELRVVRHPLKKLKIIFEAKQLITKEVDSFH